MNGAVRRSIEVPGLEHGGQPIPSACRIGNIVVSGGISGIDRATGVLSPDGAEQCRHLFRNLAAILDAAEASPADVAKLTFYVCDRSLRDAINAQWIAMFPDEQARPARHTLVYEDLPAGMLVQCDVLAVLSS